MIKVNLGFKIKEGRIFYKNSFESDSGPILAHPRFPSANIQHTIALNLLIVQQYCFEVLFSKLNDEI